MAPFYFFLALAVVLFALELGIFQLSVFWFLFAAMGASVTAGVCWFLPDTSWTAAVVYFVVATLATVVVFFPVLRKFQRQGGAMAGHDAVGQHVIVLVAMEPGAVGRVSWSGRDWDARLDPQAPSGLAAGEDAVIVALQGIRLEVGVAP